MDWFNWEIYCSLGISTALVYLFKYYYPALEKVENILKDQEIDTKELSMFKWYRIGVMSFVFTAIYTLLFPIMLLGILFGGTLLKDRTEDLLMKEALNG